MRNLPSEHCGDSGLIRNWCPTLSGTQSSSPRKSFGVDLTGAHVLVVDDIALNCRIATLQLSAFGARSLSVQSCEDALGVLACTAADGDPFQICVIDQMMMVTDGIVLPRMICTDDRYAALKTVLSSSAGVRTDKEAQMLGFDAAVPKPVNQQRLIQSIVYLLGSSDEGSPERTLDKARKEKAVPLQAPQNSGSYLLVVEESVANLKLACLHASRRGTWLTRPSTVSRQPPPPASSSMRPSSWIFGCR